MGSANLKVEYVPANSIKPYAGNAKEHPAEQVEQIKRSIQEFGFNDPIAVWHDEIIEGHGRLLAAQEIGIKKLPVIRLDGLTDEQRRAYTLAHNKLTVNSGFDQEMLAAELENLPDLDMEQFGFDASDLLSPDDLHAEYQERTQKRVENIVNIGKGNYAGSGKYDIPTLLPVQELPEITEWIGFNYVLSDKNPEGKAVHFFIDDYQLERVWNEPEKYIDKLSQYACVATPDFSPYADMPMALQIYNHYRKHWVGAYWQHHGITVIPTIRCSTDDRSLEWFLDGEPRGGIVLVSTMWSEKGVCTEDDAYRMMYDTLNPCKIFVYGENIEGMRGNIEKIKTFAMKRWGR